MSVELPIQAALLQAEIQKALGLPLTLTVTSAEGDPSAFSLAEQEVFSTLAHTPRRPNWLKGRAALKDLLVALGESTETTALSFPHPRLSLTHSGAYAFAVGVPEAFGLAGLGVDYEANRFPSEKSTRFFLREEEEAWLSAVPEPQQPDARLRLWTVKEALFKADLANASTRYLDYALIDAAATRGIAHRQDDGSLAFRYCTIPVGEGYLSVAFYHPMLTQGVSIPDA